MAICNVNRSMKSRQNILHLHFHPHTSMGARTKNNETIPFQRYKQQQLASSASHNIHSETENFNGCPFFICLLLPAFFSISNLLIFLFWVCFFPCATIVTNDYSYSTHTHTHFKWCTVCQMILHIIKMRSLWPMSRFMHTLTDFQ